MDAVYTVPITTVALYILYRRWNRISVADIPGPEPESFVLGNLSEFQRGQAGEADFKWQAQFGDVVRIKGILGTNRLLISDPKALHYIFSCGYQYQKQGLRREVMRLLGGPGLAWAEGDTHRRQRAVNSPAFGTGQARSCIPIFAAYAKKLSAQWKEKSAEGSAVVNTPNYFTRFFLDVIGEAAFDHKFGATDNEEDPIAKALSSVAPALSLPSKAAIFIFGLMELLPLTLIQLYMRYAPLRALRNSRRSSAIAIGFAKKLVDQKAEALLAGKGKRDIMSLLVKANASEDARRSLTADEMYAQMQTILQGGHETTAITLSWALWELTQHADVQSKLRAEIAETERAMRAARGDDAELTWEDLEAMPYTIAVMKETLRMHPVSSNSMRETTRDDVLPLSKPIVTKSGRKITEITIPKHQILILSICAYNRNPHVFGADAQVYNPERWLDGSDVSQTEANIGVYGNLMTFGGGHRACIGWRFAVYELQTFLIELVKTFELSMDPALASKVRRVGSLGMQPVISGELEKGPQLPVTITAVHSL